MKKKVIAFWKHRYWEIEERKLLLTTFFSIPQEPMNLCCTRWKRCRGRSPKGQQWSPVACRTKPLLLAWHLDSSTTCLILTHLEYDLDQPVLSFWPPFKVQSPLLQAHPSLADLLYSFECRDSAMQCSLLGPYLSPRIMSWRCHLGWILGKKILGRRNDNGRNQKNVHSCSQMQCQPLA